MKTGERKTPVLFMVLAATILLAIFIIENINHRFWLNDFKVYYGGAEAMLHGTPVYGSLFSLGSGYYKYSPFTLFLILPYCAFSFSTAAVIHFFILCIVILILFQVLWNIIQNYFFNELSAKGNLILSLSFVTVINHLVRELHLGNINVVLLLLSCISLLLVLKKRDAGAGVLLAVVVITKPFFGLLVVPLLLNRKFKALLAVGVSLLTFVFFPAIFLGLKSDLQLHKEWVHALFEHNAAFPSNNTIESLVTTYLKAGLPSHVSFILLAMVCLISVLISRVGNNNPMPARDKNLIFGYFFILAVLPSVFRTDTQHFLLTLPVLIFLLCKVYQSGKIYDQLLFVALVLMYGANSSDVFGKSLSERIGELGILGLSNLILITWLLIIHINFEKKKNANAL